MGNILITGQSVLYNLEAGWDEGCLDASSVAFYITTDVFAGMF